jgi:hypothetical protein
MSSVNTFHVVNRTGGYQAGILLAASGPRLLFLTVIGDGDWAEWAHVTSPGSAYRFYRFYRFYTLQESVIFKFFSFTQDILLQYNAKVIKVNFDFT